MHILLDLKKLVLLKLEFMKYLHKLFVFVIVQLTFLSYGQKAIVFSSSIGYYNYRQTANALKVYHKLK